MLNRALILSAILLAAEVKKRLFVRARQVLGRREKKSVFLDVREEFSCLSGESARLQINALSENLNFILITEPFKREIYIFFPRLPPPVRVSFLPFLVLRGYFLFSPRFSFLSKFSTFFCPFPDLL